LDELVVEVNCGVNYIKGGGGPADREGTDRKHGSAMNAMDVVQDIEFMSETGATRTGDVVGSSATPSAGSSDFLLKRVAKSMAYAIAQQAAESDVPDRHIGSFISYLISPFAMLCMGMAIILNRTVVFATTRRPTALPLSYRIMLRTVAIYTLTKQTIPLLKALKCAAPNGLGQLVPEYYFALDGSETCPTPSVLWDLYRSICIGHFIETFSSVIQGRLPYSETGMTLFEYSVAFQEVQSSQRLSVEILVVSILSAFSQIALHLQGMVNSYKYRLIPSAVFGITFLSYFGWAAYQGRLLYFPSVCVIGYLPQLAISITVLICGCIYILACVFAGGPGNMQTSVNSFHIELSEDFYSCLVKLGVLALTSVTKATYLTEATSLSAPLNTWVEYAEMQNDRANTARNDKHSSNPYRNEVSTAPAVTTSGSSTSSRGAEINNEIDGPSGFVTINRLVSAVHMVRTLGVLVAYMMYKYMRDGTRWLFYGAAGQTEEPADENEKRDAEFEREVYKLRGQIIYSSLSNDYEGGYLKLLSGDLIPDFDDSNDYDPTLEPEDDDAYEYQSDYNSDNEQEDENNNNALVASNITTTDRLGEFYNLVMQSPDYLFSLLAPKSAEEAEEARILSSHLNDTEGPLTRSRYYRTYRDESSVVAQLIMERRHQPLPPDTDPSIKESVCVVCQTAPRQVVLWPCRCFALCEECRLGLAMKNFKGCVCCRRQVDSFSRIFVP
jgi:hypothetical protein